MDLACLDMEHEMLQESYRVHTCSSLKSIPVDDPSEDDEGVSEDGKTSAGTGSAGSSGGSAASSSGWFIITSKPR